MQLYSLQFVSFVLITLLAYYLVGHFARRGQWIVLLVASMGFYTMCGWQNIAFIVSTALTTWVASRIFQRFELASKQARARCSSREEKKAVKADWQRKKRLVLLAALLLNFGVLAYLKYWNVLLAAFDANESFLASSLLLPLGISFYTFQAIGYLIDTYNNKYAPEQNFGRFLLFVSWFPQLIQGPINRFDVLATQLFQPHKLDVHLAKRGILLIGYGTLKKFAIADLLVRILTNTLDNITAGMPGSVIVFGIFVYAIQQYADFSGGIDMVRGVSQLFGVDMARNFRQPYFSISLADFWRRWHITLGAWMRDYVFYPCALTRPIRAIGKWTTQHAGKHLGRCIGACLANILVFFLVGLWHGAESHFILWGLYNGIIIALADLFAPVFAKMNEALHINTASRAHHVFCIIRTFIIVNIGWYFDRIYDFGDCMQGFYNTLFYFRADLFAPFISDLGLENLAASLAFVALCCLLVLIVSILQEKGVDVIDAILKLNPVLRFCIYSFVVFLILFSFAFNISGGGFIYANF